MASRGSKIALAGTSLFAVTTIIFVHFQQQAEKSVCSVAPRTLIFPHFYSVQIANETPPVSPGNAPRRRPRYGAAARQAREAARLRPTEAARGRIQAGAERTELRRGRPTTGRLEEVVQW